MSITDSAHHIQNYRNQNWQYSLFITMLLVSFQVNLEELRYIHPISIAKKFWVYCFTLVIFPHHYNENCVFIVHTYIHWVCVSSTAWGCWYWGLKGNKLVFNRIYESAAVLSGIKHIKYLAEKYSLLFAPFGCFTFCHSEERFFFFFLFIQQLWWSWKIIATTKRIWVVYLGHLP